MLEILQFIFQSFWHWLGTILIITAIAEGLGGMFRTIVYRRTER